MSKKHVLYLGDTSLSGAAGYLAGLMTAFGIGFDYLPSNKPLSLPLVTPVSSPRRLFILSDYASTQIAANVQAEILQQVKAGAGLLMIGGWESYHGAGGNWDGTPLAEALPVNVSTEDDRINCDQPALLIKNEDHAIVAALPWNERPPTVGGFNRVTAKPGATTLLSVQRFSATAQSGQFTFTPQTQDPMLVIGTYAAGRTAALMTDLAPHWVGGLVDWGNGERVTAQAEGSWQIEVGNYYSQFIANLLAWTGQLPGEAIG